MKFSESTFEIKKFLVEHGFPEKFEAVVILGSGLSGFTASVHDPVKIPYYKIPNFPVTSVEGHYGALISGTVNHHTVLVFSGRFHHYEGFPFSTTVLPIHLAKEFQAKKVILSNAAGAVNPRFKVGDIMVIDDIFRLFQNISAMPSQKKFQYNLYPFAEKTRRIAAKIGLEVQRGTYLFVKGPNYETKAEITGFKRLGVDVVGMSTASELIEASRLEIPAVAISLITNMAAGLSSSKLDHSEVKEAAESRKEDFANLVVGLISRL